MTKRCIIIRAVILVPNVVVVIIVVNKTPFVFYTLLNRGVWPRSLIEWLLLEFLTPTGNNFYVQPDLSGRIDTSQFDDFSMKSMMLSVSDVSVSDQSCSLPDGTWDADF